MVRSRPGVTAPASACRAELIAPDGRSVADEWRCEYPVVGHVQSRLCGPEVGLGARLWTAIELLLLRFNSWIRSDLHFRGDRMLFWRAARQFARSFFGRSLA